MLKRFRSNPYDADVIVVFPEPLREEIRALLGSGDRVAAVKLARRRTGMNLLPTVRAVDALQQ